MLTNVVCSKCGKVAEYEQAQAAGWFIHQRVNAPDGHLVIRCPEHVTEYARRIAGVPQQVRTKRIEDNLDGGMWAEYGAPEDDYSAAVGADINPETGEEYFFITYHKGAMPAFNGQTFSSVAGLIAAMREVQPDMRKWKLTEA
jgi:hypothetical protein